MTLDDLPAPFSSGAEILKSKIEATCEFHPQAQFRVRRGPRGRTRNWHIYDLPAKPFEVPMPLHDLEQTPIRRTVQQQRVRLDLLRDKLRNLKPTACAAFRDGLRQTIAELEAKFAA